MFGAVGGCTEYRAAALASRGFVTLALAYYNYEDLPSTYDITSEYLEEAIEWLYSHEYVLKTSGGIGFWGLCQGAALALYLATVSDKVKAVVAVNPCCYLMGLRLTRRGIDVPLYPWVENTSKFLEDKMTDAIKAVDVLSLHVTDDKKHLEIKVEKAGNSQLLLLVGQNWVTLDEQWTDAIVRRLEENKIQNFRVLKFPQTGHMIDSPIVQLDRILFNSNLGVVLDWGGEAKRHADAHLIMWREGQSFLRQQLDPLPLSSSDKLLLSRDRACSVNSKL